MRIERTEVIGKVRFMVYPESERANLLLKELVRYCGDHGLDYTLGGSETDPTRLLCVDIVEGETLREFSDVWSNFISTPSDSTALTAAAASVSR